MSVRRSRLMATVSALSVACAVVVVPATARADVEVPGAASVVGARPVRLLDTRTTVHPDGAPVPAGTEVAVEVDRGAGDVGVYLNVTAMLADTAGHLTVYPCGQPRPVASSLNYTAGGVIASAVLVGIGTDGQVCVFAHSTVHVVVDATGYLPAGSDLHPLTPARLLDSRGGSHPTVDGGGPIGRAAAGSVTEVQVAGRGQVPVGSGLAVVTVTAVLPDGPGHLTVFPCDAPARPVASSLNYISGDVVANTVLTRLDGVGRVCVFTHAATDLVLDLVAAAPANAEAIDVTEPARLLDTRAGHITADGRAAGVGRVPAGSVVELRVADRLGVGRLASVAALTVTAVNPAAAGHLTVYPCEADLPQTSTVNYVAGRTVANTVLVGLSRRGTVCVYSHAEADLVIDISGSALTPFEYLHPITYEIRGLPFGPGAPDVAIRTAYDQQWQVDGYHPPPYKWWDGLTRAPSIGGTGADEGRYVAYASRVPQVPGQLGLSGQHVFWYDRATHETVMISNAGDSGSPQISDDGMTVVYYDGDSQEAPAGRVALPISVWHRETGLLETLTVPASDSEDFGGAAHPVISGDGKWVAFFTGGLYTSPVEPLSPTRVYLTELGTGTYRLLSVDGSGDPVDGGPPTISYDGHAVAFSSTGDVGGVDSDPATWDVFVWRDGEYAVATTGRGPGVEQTERLIQPEISGDGRHVAWWTTAAETGGSPTWSVSVTDITDNSTVTVPTGRAIDQAGESDSYYLYSPTQVQMLLAPGLSYDGSRLAMFNEVHDLSRPEGPVVQVPSAYWLFLSPGGTQVAFAHSGVDSPDRRGTAQPALNYYGVFAGGV